MNCCWNWNMAGFFYRARLLIRRWVCCNASEPSYFHAPLGRTLGPKVRSKKSRNRRWRGGKSEKGSPENARISSWSNCPSSLHFKVSLCFSWDWVQPCLLSPLSLLLPCPLVPPLLLSLHLGDTNICLMAVPVP